MLLQIIPCQIVGWLLLQSGCRIGDTAKWINDVTELLGRDYPLLQKPAYVFQLSCYSGLAFDNNSRPSPSISARQCSIVTRSIYATHCRKRRSSATPNKSRPRLSLVLNVARSSSPLL